MAVLSDVVVIIESDEIIVLYIPKRSQAEDSQNNAGKCRWTKFRFHSRSFKGAKSISCYVLSREYRKILPNLTSRANSYRDT